MVFNSGKVEVIQGTAENPDLALTFPSVQKMNALLTGGLALPSIKGGLKNFNLLIKTLSLLMGLMKMSPNNKPKDFDGKDVWIIYCHLDSVSVKKNDKIKHNQKIGISGCTGNAGLKPDGTRGIEQKYWHCHIEASRENKFYKSDKRIDPEQFMKTKFDKDGNPIKN